MATNPILVSTNIKDLASRGAPESDVDAYVKAEGYNSPEEFKQAYKTATASYGSKVLEDVKQTGISAAPVIGASGLTALAGLSNLAGPVGAGVGGLMAGIPVGRALAHDIDIKNQEGTTGLGKGFNEYKEAQGQGEGYQLPKLGAAMAKPYAHPIQSLQEGKIASTGLAWALPLAMAKGAIGGAAEPIGLSKLIGEIPKKEIAQSIETKTPLINLVGEEGQSLAKEAQLNSPKVAGKILRTAAKENLKTQGENLQNTVNEALGSKSKLQNLDDIETNYRELAKPAYDKAFEAGDLQSKGDISELTKDDLMQKYIKQARGSAVGRELKDLPDTHIKVLDAAKQKLDDAIGTAKRAGENNEARALQGLKSELVDKVDSIVPEYKQARDIASTRFKLEEAQNIAKKIVDSENPEAIGRAMTNMTPAEKEAFSIGIRDKLIQQIGKGSMTGRVNIAEKMFGQDIPGNLVRENLKASLGEDSYNKLMSQIDPLVRSGYNASDLLGGSQTAEKQSIRFSGVSRALRRFAGKGLTKLVQKQYEPIAQMMTNPEYLKSVMNKSGTMNIGLSALKPLASKKSMVNLINLERQKEGD